MSRKDYEAIAKTIASHRALYLETTLDCSAHCLQAVEGLAYGLARTLRADNDRFNMVKFFNECGMTTVAATFAAEQAKVKRMGAE